MHEYEIKKNPNGLWNIYPRGDKRYVARNVKSFDHCLTLISMGILQYLTPQVEGREYR